MQSKKDYPNLIKLLEESIVEMTEAMGEIFIKWDDALNEIKCVLKIQLSVNEMEKLKNEQRKWLTYRDEEAKKAAAKYEGGTMETLEYISVQANLTKERCYELAENYME